MTIEYQAPGNLHGAYNTGPQTVTLGWDAAVDGVPTTYSPGSYLVNVDPSSDHIFVILIGAGGGGAGGRWTQPAGLQTTEAASAGSGGGAYLSFTIPTSALVADIPLVVGAGGVGVIGDNSQTPTDGGTTSFWASLGGGGMVAGGGGGGRTPISGPVLTGGGGGAASASFGAVPVTLVQSEHGGNGAASSTDNAQSTNRAGAGGACGGDVVATVPVFPPPPTPGSVANPGAEVYVGGRGGDGGHGLYNGAGNGGNGGNGSFPGGGAGGGGANIAPSANGSHGGTGGNGGNGQGVVIVFFPHTGPPIYGVFRDGTLIGTTTDTTFEDLTPLSGTHVYTVEVVDGSNNPLSPASGGATISIALASYFYFGKFDSDIVYVPILLTDVKGIKPRIYMPLENTTVRTRR